MFLARPSTLIQVASPKEPSVGLRCCVSSVFKTLEALFGSGPCEDVLCGIRGDSQIHLKGLLSSGPLSLPSPWNFPALPFHSSGWKAHAPQFTSRGYAHFPDQVGGQTERESRRDFPTLSGWKLLQFRRAASFPRISVPSGSCCLCHSFCHRVAWI